MVHSDILGASLRHTRMPLHRACDHETLLAVRHRGNGEHRCDGVLRSVVLVEDTDHLGFPTDLVAAEAQGVAMGRYREQHARSKTGFHICPGCDKRRWAYPDRLEPSRWL